MKLADYVISFFEKINVQHIFTVSGGGSIFLCDSLQRSKKIKYISCHHEQAVSFAAEAYARDRNNIGGALVTTGPGGTNSITGVASCWIDSVPCLFVSGQVFLNQTIMNTGLRQLGVQEIDIISLVKPITKYSIMIDDPLSVKFHLEKAYYLATSGRPGPVWIDIPANIQNSDIQISNLISFKPPKKITSNKKKLDDKITKITNLIKKSKTPLFHFGHGVKLSKSEDIVKSLINTTNIPFTTTWNASDLIPSNHKLNMGRPGAFAERGSNFIVQNCDLFISIGSRLPFMVTGYNSKDFARNAIRVTVDIDNNEVGKSSLNFDFRINADANYFIKKLSIKLKNYYFKNNVWIDYCKYIRKKYPIVLNKYSKYKNFINSYYFIETLSQVLNDKITIVTDMGLSFVGTHQAFKIKKNQKLFTNSGHAPMGWVLPAAIGACFANNKKNTICITGDGGLQMNLQELATVMHHNLPIKIFIYNNGGYLTIKQTQQLGFDSRIMGSDSNSGLSFPNYKKLSQTYKIKYFKLKNSTELKQKLKKIVNLDSSVICEIIMNNEQEQMPKAINRRDKYGKTTPTTFEDMYPFLSKNKLIESTYEFYVNRAKGEKK